MADDKFELKLELNLRRTVMISIAQTLWKLPDITKQIDKLIQKGILIENHYYFKTPGYEFEISKRYPHWEKIIEKVCKKTNSLSLPKEVEMDLCKIIILIGEKIHYFYRAGYVWCRWCKSISGTKNFYSFSSYGILNRSHASLHEKCTPENEYQLRWFLDKACAGCDEMIVDKYQENIIAYLKTKQSGLNFNNTKDKVFNIICVWQYVFYLKWIGFRDEPKSLPEKYLKNADYIIPLKDMLKLCADYTFGNDFFKMFAKRFPNLLPALDMPLFAQEVLNTRIRLILHHERLFDFEYLGAPDVLFTIQFLSPNEMSDFVRRNVQNLILLFLPFWPYFEIVPQILDFCFKNRAQIDYEFLLEYFTIAIAYQKQMKYQIRKTVYLESFRKVWAEAPERVKSEFLVKRTKTLISEGVQDLIIKLTEEDFNKDKETLNRIIVDKCEELLKTEAATCLIIDFVNKVTICEGEFYMFRDSYLNDNFFNVDGEEPPDDGYYKSDLEDFLGEVFFHLNLESDNDLATDWNSARSDLSYSSIDDKCYYVGGWPEVHPVCLDSDESLPPINLAET